MTEARRRTQAPHTVLVADRMEAHRTGLEEEHRIEHAEARRMDLAEEHRIALEAEGRTGLVAPVRTVLLARHMAAEARRKVVEELRMVPGELEIHIAGEERHMVVRHTVVVGHIGLVEGPRTAGHRKAAGRPCRCRSREEIGDVRLKGASRAEQSRAE